MRLLLDTHTFIWFVEDDPRLSNHARLLLEDPRRELWLSIASVWEMAIKVNFGKLSLGVAKHPAQNEITILGIGLPHTFLVAQFPLHHRDPFDCLLAAQSLMDNLPLISADPRFDSYGVNRTKVPAWQKASKSSASNPTLLLPN